MRRRLLLSCALLGAIAAPSSLAAQLLGDRISGDSRQCSYLGTEQDGQGRVVPRTLSVPAEQQCPVTAPYRDPNRPIPGNAALVRETTTVAGRQCVYTQGGVEYFRFVPSDRQCEMTPDLLARALATPDTATTGR